MSQLSESNKNLYGRKLIKQVRDNRLDYISYSKQKEYEYFRGLNVLTLNEYCSLSGLYCCDFFEMIKVYEKTNSEIMPFLVVKDGFGFGGLSKYCVYPKDKLEKVEAYFKDNNLPLIFKEYVSMREFINLIRGDEDFKKVRIKWYKRFEGMKNTKRKRKPNGGKKDISEMPLRKIKDPTNNYVYKNAFLYNFEDLMAIRNVLDK